MITLPPDMTRCLAHDIKPRQFWPCANFCERHQQIARDHRPSSNVAINFCGFDTRLPLRVPLGGFPKDDEQ
jgi:hypothetical protein